MSDGKIRPLRPTRAALRFMHAFPRRHPSLSAVRVTNRLQKAVLLALLAAFCVFAAAGVTLLVGRGLWHWDSPAYHLAAAVLKSAATFVNGLFLAFYLLYQVVPARPS